MTNYPAFGPGPVILWRWTRYTPDAPAHARTALRCALRQLGYDGEAIDDAVLAVSEFVANAIEHAVGPYEMRLRRTAAEVLCEVQDHDPRIPEIPASVPCSLAGATCCGDLDSLSVRGRGLRIVHELTRGAWGFTKVSATAKAAWLALPANPVDPLGPPSRN